MAQTDRLLGNAFLFVNSYRNNWPRKLETLPRIDEAAKDFWNTFHALGFGAVVYYDINKDDFVRVLAAAKTTVAAEGSAKYAVFYFIGHGGDGDSLFMEGGGDVTTKEVVEGFASLPHKYKLFFIDACRGAGLQDAYCLTMPDSFMARSTLPYRQAHTSGTYGIWSQQLLTELRMSTADLEATLKSVAGKVGEQQAQYTNNGLGAICWKTEASLAQPVPLYPDFILELSEGLEYYRKWLGISGSCLNDKGSDHMKEMSCLAAEILELKRKRSRFSTTSEYIYYSLTEKSIIFDYTDMKTELEMQDVMTLHDQCDPGDAIRLLYANALECLVKLFEPHLDAVKAAADTYVQVLEDGEYYTKRHDIQSAETVRKLLNQMSTIKKWKKTAFLQQAVSAIPNVAREKKVAQAILCHYRLHLNIYQRATRLNVELAKEKVSESTDKGKGVVAAKKLVPMDLTSAKSFVKITCEDCHFLQDRVLRQEYGIPEEMTICIGTEERKSTTVTFLVPNEFTYTIMQRSTRLETVWVFLELEVIEVAISGFTFNPSMECFIAILTGSRPFTADLLGVTEEPLSGQPLSTKRIAQYQELHDEVGSETNLLHAEGQLEDEQPLTMHSDSSGTSLETEGGSPVEQLPKVFERRDLETKVESLSMENIALTTKLKASREVEAKKNEEIRNLKERLVPFLKAETQSDKSHLESKTMILDTDESDQLATQEKLEIEMKDLERKVLESVPILEIQLKVPEPSKRAPSQHRWWMKQVNLPPVIPGGVVMAGELDFRRDPMSKLLKANSGTEWMYRKRDVEKSRRAAASTLHQHEFTHYHQRWLADHVQEEEEESCKQWFLHQSPEVTTVREAEEYRPGRVRHRYTTRCTSSAEDFSPSRRTRLIPVDESLSPTASSKMVQYLTENMFPIALHVPVGNEWAPSGKSDISFSRIPEELDQAEVALPQLQIGNSQTEKLKDKCKGMEAEHSDLISETDDLADIEHVERDFTQTSVAEDETEQLEGGELALPIQIDSNIMEDNFENFERMVQNFTSACTSVISHRDEGIATLENAAQEINRLMRASSAAKVSGYTASIVGGALFTVGTGLLIGGVTVVAGIPLMAIGGAVGGAGTVAAIGDTVGQLVKRSRIVNQAKTWLKDNRGKCENLISAHDSLIIEYERIVEIFPDIYPELPPGTSQVGEIVTTWKRLMQHSADESMQMLVEAASDDSRSVLAQGFRGGFSSGAEAPSLLDFPAKSTSGMSGLVMMVDLGLLVKSIIDLNKARTRKGKLTKVGTPLMKIATAVREENNLLREATGCARTGSTDDPTANVFRILQSTDSISSFKSDIQEDDDTESATPLL